MSYLIYTQGKQTYMGLLDGLKSCTSRARLSTCIFSDFYFSLLYVNLFTILKVLGHPDILERLCSFFLYLFPSLSHPPSRLILIFLYSNYILCGTELVRPHTVTHSPQVHWKITTPSPSCTQSDNLLGQSLVFPSS